MFVSVTDNDYTFLHVDGQSFYVIAWFVMLMPLCFRRVRIYNESFGVV